jgi:hypothetical protein
MSPGSQRGPGTKMQISTSWHVELRNSECQPHPPDISHGNLTLFLRMKTPPTEAVSLETKCSVFLECLTLKMKPLYETSNTTHPLTQHHILRDMNHQQQCCENLKSHSRDTS